MNEKSMTMPVKNLGESRAGLGADEQLSGEGDVAMPATKEYCSTWAWVNTTGWYDWMDWHHPYLLTE
ncbi:MULTISPECIES: hypothetical protein [Paraburkholderia]|jgi:hypothetical protein|uniref:Uncharacterized protein n=1 Tax=Paraburkholderia phenazinium TaxID=60549 RepID=A0A1N6K092_9BURK|nr:hypothetical protein [Paraburkholderia phenazinium]SIO49746.1 hypothetical protein SAMN05444168_5555 [Paraburkholderia phenazinium]